MNELEAAQLLACRMKFSYTALVKFSVIFFEIVTILAPLVRALLRTASACQQRVGEKGSQNVNTEKQLLNVKLEQTLRDFRAFHSSFTCDFSPAQAFSAAPL